MILGIGVDLLHLPRLRTLLSRRDPLRLAGRICSRAELEEWQKTVGGGLGEASERYLALRWAAKEAAYKALYPAFRPTWKDLEIRKIDKKPSLDFSPAFRPVDIEKGSSKPFSPENVKMHLSVSHDADLLIAYVVAEKVS
ncbi:hypothetical protein JCM6882_004200 [Rhodosporidiobolus microsporus]